MKLLIMHSSSVPCSLVSLRLKYLQHPIVKLSVCSSLSVKYEVSHQHTVAGKIIVLYILILYS